MFHRVNFRSVFPPAVAPLHISQVSNLDFATKPFNIVASRVWKANTQPEEIICVVLIMAKFRATKSLSWAGIREIVLDKV